MFKEENKREEGADTPSPKARKSYLRIDLVSAGLVAILVLGAGVASAYWSPGGFGDKGFGGGRGLPDRDVFAGAQMDCVRWAG